MELGQRIQLNHPPGQTCANPIPASQDGFTIIDTYGIHSVTLDFCGCESAPSGGHTVQLLRRRLMPATVTMPRTAATFNILERFQFLWYQAKISLLQFYQSLARMTDNTGLDPPKVLLIRQRSYCCSADFVSHLYRIAMRHGFGWSSNGGT